MVHRANMTHWSLWRLLAFCAWLAAHSLSAQGTADHLSDKMYVIRISAICSDQVRLETTVAPAVRKALQDAYGLLEHVEPFLHAVMSKDGSQWFLVYFNPGRQSEVDLRQDHYLFDWALHGHDVQIHPLEQVASPAALVDLKVGVEQKR